MKFAEKMQQTGKITPSKVTQTHKDRGSMHFNSYVDPSVDSLDL